MRRFTSHLCPALVGSALAAVVSLTSTPSGAAGIIKNPGQHPNYSVELEPHGLIGWDNWWWGGTGYGLGMHAVIPFLDNGPISKINNNMGIGFGLDWVHYETDYWYGYCGNVPGGLYCNPYGNSFLFPIYVQWNFFLTEVISVFGEPGFGLGHHSFNIDYPGGCPVGRGVFFVNGCNNSHFGPFFYFEGGARFLFGDTVGLTVRIGYPLFTVGASFLL